MPIVLKRVILVSGASLVNSYMKLQNHRKQKFFASKNKNRAKHVDKMENKYRMSTIITIVYEYKCTCTHRYVLWITKQEQKR